MNDKACRYSIWIRVKSVSPSGRHGRVSTVNGMSGPGNGEKEDSRMSGNNESVSRIQHSPSEGTSVIEFRGVTWTLANHTAQNVNG